MTIERVLVLEREEAGGESLEQHLVAEGYQVLRARDVAQATRLLRSGPVHCFLVEVHPGLVDVRDFLEKLRTFHGEVPRVLCVAPRDVERMHELMSSGDEILLRPATREHVARLMNRYRDAARTAMQVDYMRNELFGSETASALLTEPRGLRDLIERANRISLSRGCVLVEGPVGAGKVLLARYLHENGPGAEQPFIQMNCSRIQPSLQESDLFGHEPGAFPGANETASGLVELADGGTLVLEEAGSLSLDVQHRLYRFLQSGSMRRMGGQRSIHCRVRVIATTSRRLQDEVSTGRFSADLWRRFSQQVLQVPALSERKQDIGLLARRFLHEAPAWGSSRVQSISPEAVSRLSAHDWPGNVEELRATVENIVLADPGEVILPMHLNLGSPENATNALEQAVGMTVADMEREMILRTLEHTKGNRTAASKLLGLTTRTLSNKIRIYRAQGYHVIGGRKKRPVPTPV